MFVSSHVEIPMPMVVVLGGGNFRKCLGHENGGAFVNGINALMSDSREVPLPFHHMKVQ